MKNRQIGFSLVELVVFITVLSVIAVAVFVPFKTSIKEAPASDSLTRAVEIAKEKMETLIGLRYTQGFSAIVPQCSGTTSNCSGGCSASLGYNVIVEMSNWQSNNDWRWVKVTACKPSGGYAELQTVFANY